MNEANSSAVTTAPVGLFGLQMNTREVVASMEERMEGRFREPSISKGTGRGSAPQMRAKMGYASKLRHGKTMLFPGWEVACASCWHSADEPQPSATLAGSTPR